MEAKDRLKELKQETIYILRSSNFSPSELYDMNLNCVTRQKIDAFADVHDNNKCYLGKVNRYSEDEGKPGLVPYDGQLVYNFEYGFMIPVYDAKLINLIMDRDEAEYTGTKEDFVIIGAIMDRIQELNGINLFWV